MDFQCGARSPKKLEMTSIDLSRRSTQRNADKKRHSNNVIERGPISDIRVHLRRSAAENPTKINTRNVDNRYRNNNLDAAGNPP